MRTVPLLIVWLLLTALFCWLQTMTCCGAGGFGFGDKKAPNAFAVSGDGLKQNCEFRSYVRSSDKLVNPFTQDADCHSKLAEYIKNHPEKEYIVEGRYSENEEYENGFYSNLGLARANLIKSDLTKNFGIPGSQIKTTSSLVDETAFVADTLKDGYRITLAELENADFSGFNPEEREIVLHFNTNSSVPILTPEIRNEFAQFIDYIDANDNANLLVTGHTDTNGDADTNMELGQTRANEIKDYLNQNGISSARISTSSKGEEEPVSEIDAENRRVTINIQTNNQE